MSNYLKYITFFLKIKFSRLISILTALIENCILLCPEQIQTSPNKMSLILIFFDPKVADRVKLLLMSATGSSNTCHNARSESGP